GVFAHYGDQETFCGGKTQSWFYPGTWRIRRGRSDPGHGSALGVVRSGELYNDGYHRNSDLLPQHGHDQSHGFHTAFAPGPTGPLPELWWAFIYRLFQPTAGSQPGISFFRSPDRIKRMDEDRKSTRLNSSHVKIS